MCICPSVLKLYYHGSVGVEVYADVIIWHTTVAWYKGIPLCIIYMYYICGCVSRINALSPLLPWGSGVIIRCLTGHTDNHHNLAE